MHEDRQYIWLVCAILYMLAVGWGANHTEQWLRPVKGPLRRRLQDAHFCTGDVLLWSSHWSLRTDVEKLLCGSHFTHVGMVFVDAAGVPYVWECLRTGHQVVPLMHVVVRRSRKQTCFWRRINRPLEGARLEVFMRWNMTQPYSFDIWRGVVRRWCSSLHLPRAPHPDLVHSRFCSQLVAETYAFLDVLDFSNSVNLSPHLVLPGDFAAGNTAQLPWVNGYALSGEVELVVGEGVGGVYRPCGLVTVE
jgi:hypothetical protein